MSKLKQKLRVEHATRINGQFIVECTDPVHGEAITDRLVSEDEVIAFLDGDVAARTIPVDAGSEYERSIDFADWLEENAGLELEAVLGVIIDKREGRTEAAPLPKMELAALSGIVHGLQTAA